MRMGLKVTGARQIVFENTLRGERWVIRGPILVENLGMGPLLIERSINQNLSFFLVLGLPQDPKGEHSGA